MPAGSSEPVREPDRLSEGQILIASTRLDAAPADLATLRRLLSRDELDRAARFRFARDRDRYVVGRGELRRLLGSYLEVAPAEIHFTYSEFRKPAVSSPPTRLSFNLSHADDLAVYALCLGPAIGIDIERLRPDVDDDRVPEHFFSKTEVETLRLLPETARPAAFLRCWTRKEAFLKARGDGLTLALDSFDVTLTEHEQPRIVRTAWDPAEARRWSLHDLTNLFPGYVAALAVEGRGWSLALVDRERRTGE